MKVTLVKGDGVFFVLEQVQAIHREGNNYSRIYFVNRDEPLKMNGSYEQILALVEKAKNDERTS